MSIRDIRAEARKALHQAMRLPALYIASDGATPVACYIRIHDEVRDFGDMVGFDYAPAERRVPVPEIVTMVDEVTPVRGGVFSVAADEAYVIETLNPVHGITRNVQVTRMTQAEIDAAGLPVPS